MTLRRPRLDAGAAADAPEAVITPAPRYVPRGVRVLNAGVSGFLFAQEGDDRLHWVDYRTGADRVLDQQLEKKPVYDVDEGRFDGLATSQGWYGDGSDTVALYTEAPAPQVALWNAADAHPVVTRIAIPQGQSYVGTFGTSVLTRTGSWMETTSLHVLTSADGAVSDRTVTDIPEGATFTSGIEDADARSVVIRYQEPATTPGGERFPRWGVLDLATAAVRVLPPAVPGGHTWDEADNVRLGPDAVYLRWRDRTYTRDRDNPLTQLRESETNWIQDGSDFAVVGSAAIGVRDINAGDNSHRGEQLRSGALDGSGESDVLLQAARTGFATAPDGSVIVVGAKAKTPDAALEWAIHRVTAKPDGHPQISRVVEVEPAPANVYGLALGSGILSVADESGHV